MTCVPPSYSKGQRACRLRRSPSRLVEAFSNENRIVTLRQKPDLRAVGAWPNPVQIEMSRH